MAEIKKSKKLSTGDSVEFKTYLTRILKQEHPELKMSLAVKDQLNTVLNVIGEEIVRKAVDLVVDRNAQTISANDIKAAFSVLVDGEKLKDAGLRYLKTAINKYYEGKKETTTAARAGITLPPSRMKGFFKRYNFRLGGDSPIYVASLLEYILLELLELSGNAAIDNNARVVTIRHLYLAVELDDELTPMFTKFGLKLSGTGILPGGFLFKDDGTKLHKKIQKMQQNSQCFNIAPTQFNRVVKEYGKTLVPNIKFDPNGLAALHLYVESYLIKLLYEANVITKHANRKGLEPKDIHVARRKCIN